MFSEVVDKIVYSYRSGIKKDFAKVVGFKKGIKNVKIPKFIAIDNVEYKVVEILDYAFKNCKTLKSITIPETVDKVGYDCFMNCVNLKKINVLSHHTVFKSNAFKGCVKLIDKLGFVYSHSSFLKKDLAIIFSYNDDVDIRVPDGVTRIGPAVFKNNKNLQSVQLPNSLTKIGFYAFSECVSLTEIHLPHSVNNIEFDAFSMCTSLEKIVLPDNLTTIKNCLFKGCEKLSYIEFGAALDVIGEEAFSGCKSLNVVHFPESLCKIMSNSFYMCENLSEIYIPASVFLIQDKSFSSCDNLEKVVFAPRNETLSSDSSHFYYTDKMRDNFVLTKQELSENVVVGFNETDVISYRHQQILYWDYICDDSKEIILNEWRKPISNKVMYGKNKLRNLVFLQSTAKEIATYFDQNCHLELPELELYLKHNIQHQNTQSTAIILGYKNKTFDSNTLQEYQNQHELVEIGLELPTITQLCEKWEVVLRENYIVITKYKGQNTTEILPVSIDTGLPIGIINSKEKGDFDPIRRLVLPEKFMQTIGSCFEYSTLEEIVLPKSLTHIKFCMFSRAINLRHIELHEGIVCIEGNAFLNCKSLTEICLPASLKSVATFAFAGCDNLEKVVFLESDNCSEIDKNIVDVITDNSVDTDAYNVDDKPTFNICSEAFYNCINLKEIILSKHFMNFHIKAFTKCPALEFLGVYGGDNLIEKVN